MGLRIHRRKAEEKVRAGKPKIKLLLVDFRSAMSNDSRERWWQVVGQFVEAMVVMWPHVHKREVGEGVGG